MIKLCWFLHSWGRWTAPSRFGTNGAIQKRVCLRCNKLDVRYDDLAYSAAWDGDEPGGTTSKIGGVTSNVGDAHDGTTPRGSE